MALATPAPYFTSPTGKQAIYYHCSWSVYDRKFFPKNLPIDKLTDIAYAFFNVDETGRVFSGDEWADYQNPFNAPGEGIDPQNTWDSPPDQLGQLGQFLKLRKQGHKFNMHASVGGWSWSGKFSPAVSTADNRERFVTSLAGIMNRYPGLFTGISLDWEYLSDDGINYGMGGNIASKDDPANFMELLKLIRKKLPGFKISLCTVAAPEKLKFPVKQISEMLDEVHVMTYDFMDGSWGAGPTAGHHTNLSKSPFVPYSVEVATETMLGLGVDPKKIFIGVAFYSRGFGNTDGLGKPYTTGSTDKTWDAGSVDYKLLPLPGATESWDPVANAAYSYDPKKRNLNSYDEPRSVKLKCDYVHAKGLGGVLIWEDSADHPYDNPRSLMKVIHDNLTHGGGGTPTPIPTPPTPKPPTPKPPTPKPPTPKPPTPKPPTPKPPTPKPPTPKPPTPKPPTPKPPTPNPPTPTPTPTPMPTPNQGITGVDGEPFFYNAGVKMNCPTGLVWNSSSNACDWPKK